MELNEKLIIKILGKIPKYLGTLLQNYSWVKGEYKERLGCILRRLGALTLKVCHKMKVRGGSVLVSLPLLDKSTLIKLEKKKKNLRRERLILAHSSKFCMLSLVGKPKWGEGNLRTSRVVAPVAQRERSTPVHPALGSLYS